MNRPTSVDQDAWNKGFDFFFERKDEQKLAFLGEVLFAPVWMNGFLAASNYCEHLLKEAKGRTGTGTDF